MKSRLMLIGLSLLALSVGSISQAKGGKTGASSPQVNCSPAAQLTDPLACNESVSTSLPTDAVSALKPSALIIPVTGTLSNGGAFHGTFSVTKFALGEAGQLLVSGVLTGITTKGGERAIINQIIEAVVGSLTAPGAGCDVLLLDLGPLNLDLLGLVVDLAPVNLDIIAEPGAGNLLGNLLCAVTHLLDNPLAGLAGLGALISQINEILAG